MTLLRVVPRPPEVLGGRTDDELMVLAQAGRRDAFAVLVERHAERLIRACSRLVNDADAGSDLAQETWVGLWAARSQYRPEGKFTLWLITAARNRCRNHLRHGGVRRDAQRAAVADETAPSAEQIDALLVQERQRHVREALARLPGKMREALLLRFAEGLRYEQMAQVLGAGESTLRSRVHHGLRLLRSVLERAP